MHVESLDVHLSVFGLIGQNPVEVVDSCRFLSFSSDILLLKCFPEADTTEGRGPLIKTENTE